jgi:hypothetical protein
MPKKASKRDIDVEAPQALIRKHTRITKKGRVELKNGWSDKRIAKKTKAKVALVRQLRDDLYSRLIGEIERPPSLGK